MTLGCLSKATSSPKIMSDPTTKKPISDLDPELMEKIATTSLQIFEQAKSTLIPSLLKVAEEYNLRSGLYYIGLIDLSGSTVASSKLSKSQNDEWVGGFANLAQKALDFPAKNTAVFLKTIGDGSLFLFRNFDDILEWRSNVSKLCEEHNKRSVANGNPDFYQYYFKLIVHLGEVLIDLKKKDARSFALNIVFKIEKQFDKGSLGITEAVKQAIIEEINSGRFEIEKTSEDYVIDESSIKIPLWKLSIKKP